MPYQYNLGMSRVYMEEGKLVLCQSKWTCLNKVHVNKRMPFKSESRFSFYILVVLKKTPD